MKINGITTNAKKFAFDGCHKIYLLSDEKEECEAVGLGFKVFDIEKLQKTWEKSCGLRFINSWDFKLSFVSQFEELKIN